MIAAFELAGVFAAHGIWCLSDGDGLIPMLAFQTADGERQMRRFAMEELGQGVELGKQQLASNEMQASVAALVYDGRITLETGKVDALIIEIRSYATPQAEAVVAIPYTPQSTGQFAVHRPKLLAWDHCDEFEIDDAFQAFFAGVDSHEKGAEVWNQSIDDSL